MKCPTQLEKNTQRIITLFFISVILTLIIASTSSQADDYKTVLYISSYNNAFDTPPHQLKGISDVFSRENIRYDIEFMDLKRFNNTEVIDNFYTSLKFRLENTSKYDAIIVADDIALQFAMDYQEELFSGIPIVFTCINDVERANKAYDLPGITGITERNPVKETIEIANVFNSGAKKVIGIVDNTLTGMGDMEGFLELSNEFPSLELEVLNFSNYHIDDFCDVISALDDDSLLIVLSAFMDADGKTYSITQSSRIISNAANIPAYRTSIGGINDGIIGGCQVSYEEQGVLAAEMVVSIFNGVSTESIAMKDNTTMYIFDYNIINKFNIDKSLIPKDAILVNKEPSFYEENKKVIQIVSIIAVIFIIFMIIVGRDDLKRRAVERELQESRAKYKELAYTDTLTGMNNRIAFNSYMASKLENNSNAGILMFLDIDNFKYINDTHGHECGDIILKQVSERLTSITSKYNPFIARMDGDEFCIVLEDLVDEDEIKELSDNLLSAMSLKFLIEGIGFYLTMSIGIVKYPSDGNDFQTLIKNADVAMYEAKDKGKDRYIFFVQNMRLDMERKLNIQNNMRSAIENDEFTLNYQPHVDLNTNKVIGFEALIRWESKELGPVYPDIFIPIAEENGFIVKIGNWVLETACNFAKIINTDENNPIVITINVSGVQLVQNDFVETVKNIINKIGVNPKLIGIEITETSLVEQLKHNASKLEELREFGIATYLDDFGTGYSSLNYLMELPVEVLKVDKSFIDGITNNSEHNMTADIIMIAHKIGLRVVAEGVETQEQLDMLKLYGCDAIQGYFMSKPMKKELVSEYISNNKKSQIG